VGYKGVREVDGAAVLDTFANWQREWQDGCLALVRFTDSVSEIEVETYCTEIKGGAGGFIVNTPVVSLPTVTLDDPCTAAFSLFHGTGPVPGCVLAPDDFLMGSSAPEPMAALLLGLGLSAPSLRRRR
jgi:hypothetical protein